MVILERMTLERASQRLANIVFRVGDPHKRPHKRPHMCLTSKCKSNFTKIVFLFRYYLTNINNCVQISIFTS